jgi:predicted DNA binding CopG/RHH family protein
MEQKENFNQIAYQNNYIKEKYDRINLLVPKGGKEKIKQKAAEAGKSVNEYINELIEREL